MLVSTSAGTVNKTPGSGAARSNSVKETLALTDRGTGAPAVLMIPGWCGDRSVFDPLLRSGHGERRMVSVDLPDHGDSPERDDVTIASLVDDLVDVLDDRALDVVVPVALSHAGWAAIELRRRLGPDRVPGVVLLDWMVLGTPPGFAAALAGLQSAAWADVRGALVEMWTDGLEIDELTSYVASMCGYGARHWQRAGREIASGFAGCAVPLDALDALQPCPTLHLYAQPRDEGYLESQQAYAAAHAWFHVRRVDASSHFPMFEAPAGVTEAIEHFVGGLS